MDADVEAELRIGIGIGGPQPQRQAIAGAIADNGLERDGVVAPPVLSVDVLVMAIGRQLTACGNGHCHCRHEKKHVAKATASAAPPCVAFPCVAHWLPSPS